MQNSYPKRLEQALSKLYAAFNENRLNPECCLQCAAGNIADNKDAWKHFTDHHGSEQLNYVGKVHEMLGRKINGYLPSQLLKIEAVFLGACGYQLPLHYKTKGNIAKDSEAQYEGLCAVIAYLCALDNVANVLDITQVFEKVVTRKTLVAV